MTEAAIQQLAGLIDLAFGKPGSAQVAVNNIDLINALADAVKSAQAKQQTMENDNG